MKLEHWHTARDGPLSEANFRRKLQARGYQCSIYTYVPGTRFPDHAHPIDKIDGVLAGRFRISMDGGSHILEPGDCIEVPRGRVHSAEVIGDQAVVSIDATRS